MDLLNLVSVSMLLLYAIRFWLSFCTLKKWKLHASSSLSLLCLEEAIHEVLMHAFKKSKCAFTCELVLLYVLNISYMPLQDEAQASQLSAVVDLSRSSSHDHARQLASELPSRISSASDNESRLIL